MASDVSAILEVSLAVSVVHLITLALMMKAIRIVNLRRRNGIALNETLKIIRGNCCAISRLDNCARRASEWGNVEFSGKGVGQHE